MRSFISSSKSAAHFHAKMLVGICAVLIIAFELSSDYLLEHHSETLHRPYLRVAIPEPA
jgi:hypothetical protein